jgi:peroxiredoxin
MAERLLYEVKHLAIGLEVPDLEGKDLDDTVFKLSDYRGKVVFLDFWAHW